MKLSLLAQAVTAFREGRIGDAAVLKAVAMSPASDVAVEEAVSRLQSPLPDLSALTQRLQPETGTLGWEYEQFIDRHKIKPLHTSPDLIDRVGHSNLVAARYVLLHDTFHVLLGFDISRCGELAVWSFVAAQRYNVAYAGAAGFANWFYPMLEPSSFRQLRRYRALGLKLGAQVPCLITQPIEKFWTTSLQETRTKFGISAHDDGC